MDKITATYDHDSKRYHRFTIDKDQEVVGNIYIPKGEDIPDEIAITLRTPGEGGKSENSRAASRPTIIDRVERNRRLPRGQRPKDSP